MMETCTWKLEMITECQPEKLLRLEDNNNGVYFQPSSCYSRDFQVSLRKLSSDNRKSKSSTDAHLHNSI